MLLLIIMISLQCHNGNVWWSYRKEHSEVILDASCSLVGELFMHFRVMLSSKIVLEGPWGLCSGWKSIFQVPLHPCWILLDSCWEGFWRYFRIFSWYRLHWEFLLILSWILMDFDTLWRGKIEQKAWRVVQKSTLHVVCYRTSMDIDSGRILGSG